MNVLYYLGVGPVFKGVFRDHKLDTAINELRKSNQDFTDIIGYLALEERNLDFKVCHNLILIENSCDRNCSKRLRGHLRSDVDLDGSGNVDLFRKEQAILKVLVFGTSTEIGCSICLRQFTADLMTLIHIKPRSHCSELERLDLSGVMPAREFVYALII